MKVIKLIAIALVLAAGWIGVAFLTFGAMDALDLVDYQRASQDRAGVIAMVVATAVVSGAAVVFVRRRRQLGDAAITAMAQGVRLSRKVRMGAGRIRDQVKERADRVDGEQTHRPGSDEPPTPPEGDEQPSWADRDYPPAR